MDDGLLRILLVEPSGDAVLTLLHDRTLPAHEVSTFEHAQALTQLRTDPSRHDVVVLSLHSHDTSHMMSLVVLCTERAAVDHPPFILVLHGDSYDDKESQTCLYACLPGAGLTAEQLWQVCRRAAVRRRAKEPPSPIDNLRQLILLEQEVDDMRRDLDGLTKLVRRHARLLRKNAAGRSVPARIRGLERWRDEQDATVRGHVVAIRKTASGLFPIALKLLVAVLAAILAYATKRGK